MNQKNLKPFNAWTPDDHRAVSVKGGIASGLARRRSSAIRELAMFVIYKVQATEHLEKMRLKEKRRQQRALKRKRTAEPDG